MRYEQRSNAAKKNKKKMHYAEMKTTQLYNHKALTKYNKHQTAKAIKAKG